jgi:hypothetical protein
LDEFSSTPGGGWAGLRMPRIGQNRIAQARKFAGRIFREVTNVAFGAPECRRPLAMPGPSL